MVAAASAGMAWTGQPSHLLLPFIPGTAKDVAAAVGSAVPAHPGGECHTKTRAALAYRCDRIRNRVIRSPREQIMTDASAQHRPPTPATVVDIMHPPVTAVDQNDHLAASARFIR